MRNIIIAIALLLFLPATSEATPSITSASNGVITLTDGGTKSTAAPIKFDNFEDGTNGEDVDSGGYWSVDGTAPVYNNSNNRGSSTLNAKAVLAGLQDIFYKDSLDFSSNKIFVSFWVRFNRGAGDDDYQIKLWRVCTGDSTVGYPSIGNYNWGCETSARSYYYENRYGTTSVAYGSGITAYTQDVWTLVEFKCYMSDISTENGGFSVTNNCVEQFSKDDVILREDSSNFTQVRFGEYIGNGGTTATQYFDDIYVDNSWAHIAVGDNASYDSCTNREIQIPTAWSATEISFTANQGAFADYETCYLFVVDEDGNVSDGYEGYFYDGTFYSGSYTATNFQASNVTFNGKITIP